MSLRNDIYNIADSAINDGMVDSRVNLAEWIADQVMSLLRGSPSIDNMIDRIIDRRVFAATHTVTDSMLKSAEEEFRKDLLAAFDDE